MKKEYRISKFVETTKEKLLLFIGLRALILTVLFGVIFFGCSKKNYEVIDNGKTKTFFNKNIPENKKFKVKLNKDFEISEKKMDDSLKFILPSVLKLYKNNYYLLDYKMSSVFKFDSKGKLKTVFGRKGQGLGEMVTPNAMVVINDTVFVMDTGNRRIAKFDISGNFYSNKIISDNHFPQCIEKLNNGNLLSLSYESNMKEDG